MNQFAIDLITRDLDNLEATLWKYVSGFEKDFDLFDDGTLGEFEARLMAIDDAAHQLLNGFQEKLIERNGVRF